MKRQFRFGMTWWVPELRKLQRQGVTERRAQATWMCISLPQLDRVRRAARESKPKTPRELTRSGRTTDRRQQQSDIQLGVRIPRPIAERLRRYSRDKGFSVALVTAVALDQLLERRGYCGGGAGLTMNLGALDELYGREVTDQRAIERRRG